VKLLLEKGANVDGLVGHSLSPLQEASKWGNLAVVEFLLEKGACVNFQQNGSPSALQIAAWGWNKSIVELLLHNGVNVNAPAGGYGTALQAASSQTLSSPADNQRIAQLLENAMEPKEQQRNFGAEVQKFSRSVRFEPNIKIAKLLLDAGADITGPGRFFSEIRSASMVRNAGVVELLIERGANNVEFRETIVEVLRQLRLSKPSPRLPYDSDSDPDLYSLAGSLDATSLDHDDNGNGVNDDDNGNAKANKDV
jgi:ankyrin repeat protein